MSGDEGGGNVAMVYHQVVSPSKPHDLLLAAGAPRGRGRPRSGPNLQPLEGWLPALAPHPNKRIRSTRAGAAGAASSPAAALGAAAAADNDSMGQGDDLVVEGEENVDAGVEFDGGDNPQEFDQYAAHEEDHDSVGPDSANGVLWGNGIGCIRVSQKNWALLVPDPSKRNRTTSGYDWTICVLHPSSRTCFCTDCDRAHISAWETGSERDLLSEHRVFFGTSPSQSISRLVSRHPHLHFCHYLTHAPLWLACCR